MSMTNQEIFDKVALHLTTQKMKSEAQLKTYSGITYTQCVYRGPDGLKCAAGALIPDELYTQDMEGKGVSHADVEPALLTVVSEDQLPLLASLQRIHDGWPVEAWPTKLAALTRQEGLLYDSFTYGIPADFGPWSGY